MTAAAIFLYNRAMPLYNSAMPIYNRVISVRLRWKADKRQKENEAKMKLQEENIMKNRYEIDWERYASLARQAAAEGAVLLRNELTDGKDSGKEKGKRALPLQPGEHIAVFGRIQFDYYKSGTGSGGLVNTKYVVGILDALKEEDLVIDSETEAYYTEWLSSHPFDQGTGWAQEPWSQEEAPLPDELVKDAAERSDAAVIIIGRTAGEDRDAAAEKGSYLLTDQEEEMLEKVCGAFDRTIVLLNVGSTIDMKWVEQYSPSAVLYVWQGGMEGGHGAADVLMGRVNPCGKLPDTIARDISDYPSTANFGGEDGNVYAEDIYVGYRYFETFAKEKTVYPFGFGLSYTDFSVECVKVERRNPESERAGDAKPEGTAGDVQTEGTAAKSVAAERAEAETLLTVKVTNTGAVPGKEVVQVYAGAPQGVLGKPVRTLAAFAKTGELKPGETEELVLTVADRSLASYDDGGLTGHRSCYVLEAGDYEFYVGTDVRNASFAGGFTLGETLVTKQCSEAAAPEQPFARMAPEGCVNTQAPVKTASMKEHMAQENISEIPCTGDRGWKLADVYDEKTDMDTFLGQLSDSDLCALVKGEGMCSPKVTPGTAAAFGGLTESLKNFGIPCGCCADGPSGIRMDCGTKAFSMPNGVCLAATFNEQLLEELYEMEGAELRKNRIDTLLGPGMNIHRNPLNGRNFEYFSEDPLLTGKMAAAQLRGMNRYGVTGTVKHFAANNQEHNRRKYNSVMSERALREIYLKGFEIAVKEGGAYSVMTTYGAVNGVWTASNYDLVTTILRKEWGFEGMVMTDWWAEMNDEGEAPSMQNLAAMVRAQNDVFMVVPDTESFPGNLEECLKNGSLKRASLQRCAANILNMLMRSPVMDRFLDRISEEEKEASAKAESEDRPDFDLVYHDVEKELTLPGGEICTDKGSSAVIGVRLLRRGLYHLTMRVKADAGELAQIPVSVFLGGNLAGTVTINGTNGEWIEKEVDLGAVFFPNNYIRLYFAQSGMQIGSLKIRWEEMQGFPG